MLSSVKIPEPLPLEIVASRYFTEWLQSQQISLAFTTYQSSRLMFLGLNHHGAISGFERIFDRAMGLIRLQNVYILVPAIKFGN